MTVLLFLTAILVFSSNVSANEINHLDMDIEINADGSVSVTETREADMSEGTENYIVFNDEDMGEVNVTNFSVEGFTEEQDWDLDASIEEKAGQYGVVETDDGVELVWGIGDYGEQTYVVHYTLENVVRNLEDGQSLYWNFNTFMDLPTDDFTMNVTSAVPFDEDMQFWGFGFSGDINREGDSIIWTSEETLTDGNDAVLLMHFPEGTYSTNVSGEGTLEEESEAAMDGSIYDNGSPGPWTIASIIGSNVAIAIAIIFVFLRFTSRRSKAGHIARASTIKKNNKELEADAPPAIDDYASIAFVLKHLQMGGFEEIFQAYMMKWTDEGHITIEIDRKPGQKLDKGTAEITIHDYQAISEKESTSFKEMSKHVKKEELKDGYEPLLWQMLIDAANDDGRIDGNRFKKWSKKNAKAVSTVADKLVEYSMSQLEANDYFKFDKERIFGIKVPITIPSQKGADLLDHLEQYKNYLKKDYRRIYENDDYRQHMLWSVLVGEGQDVQKHLAKVTPKDNSNPPVYVGYYYGPYLSSQSWSQGLGQGGFSSSAASGSGGTTGAGGGAGDRKSVV